MKRGFTLVELLITVAVMATLMTIVFRLTTVSDDQSKRTNTVIRLQKLENCLSGYYAAFGSYPPVQLHGTRDIYARINQNTGMQEDESAGTTLNAQQVDAACRSQPVRCAFPPDTRRQEMMTLVSEEILARKEEGFYDIDVTRFQAGLRMPDPGEFTSVWKEHDWRRVQLFKFGLMSYLLPRYLVMTRTNQEFLGKGGMGVPAQWSANNNDPIDATTGAKVDEGESRAWEKVCDYVRLLDAGDKAGRPAVMRDYIRVANMPTQVVCARWLPNLEGVCAGWASHELFGVKTGSYGIGYFANKPDEIEIYTAPGGGKYTLDFVTVTDGWDRELYYYSPVGYQSYTIWSAGPNGKTFPPWMSLSEFSATDKETIYGWTSDDIMRMKN